MSITQLPNQFAQGPIKGQVDLQLSPNTITCQVDATAIADLIPGQVVKVVDSAGGVPKVLGIAALTDDFFGVVNYSLKNATFPIGAYVEVSFFKGNVVYMESSAAISRNVEVTAVISGSQVSAAASGNRILGRSLDKVTAANQLLRVIVNLPGGLVP